MARPTTWRRDFSRVPVPIGEGSLDLVTVQPGETLGGTWWSYSMKSVGGVATFTNPPLAASVTVMGLILRDPNEPVPLPFNEPFGPWLWWEEVGFDHVLLNAIDGVYLNASTSGRDQRKVEAMRKNDTDANMVITVAWQTFQGSATGGETAFDVTAAVSCLIILP